MVDIVTVGQLTLDDIVFLDNKVQRRVIGGGALYSAVGARLWHAKTAIHSITGDAFYKEVIEDISEYDINTEGIKNIQGHGIELWILHESNNEKQQVPKLCSKKYTELDPLRGPIPKRLANAKAFHIAPQSVSGQKEALRYISELNNEHIVTLDLQADKFIKIDEYRNNFPYEQLTVFIPSREEIEMIWNESNMQKWLKKIAPKNIPYIIIKMGEDGSLVYDTRNDSIFKLPIYPTSAIKDTTGAGDSFCGGLIAGLQRKEDILDAAIMGTVSASFVVEHLGALNTRIPSSEELNNRYQYIKERVEKY